MDEEKNSAKQKLKEGLKPTKNMAYIALVIVLIVIILISSLYNIFKKDYEDMSENSATYSGNAMISATDGIVSYVKDEDGNYVKDENGNYIPLTAGDILEEINNISRYLKDDSESTKEEKLEYLLNAGLVTKLPYIKGLAEDKVNGIVKFYRYSEESQAQDENQEQYLLTFIDEETFNNKLNAGDSDIFKYFTMDENQQLVIACMSKTTKTITTNDPEVTESVINEIASDTYTLNENGIFTTGETTITKQSKDYQSIIEQYTIPFNLLAAFLVQTGDYDFVKELADMAYESEINVGIYENVSITTNTEDYTYKKRVEYSPSTELVFSGVNTDPAITDGRYPGVVINCIANIQENEETQDIRVEHDIERLDGIGGTMGAGVEPHVLKTAYVKAMSNGIITELAEQASDAKMFETKYFSETESRTSVTIGTTLADTWIARWEAKYVAEQNNPTPSGQNDGTEPNTARTIIECNSSSDLFGGTAKTNVDRVLSVHSNKLKQDAKDYILERTNFEESARSMTASDIRRHAESCTSSPTCEEELDRIYYNLWKEILPDAALVQGVKNNESLSQVKEHVQYELEREAYNNSDRARRQFETQLANIICEEYPIVAKSNVEINFSTTNTRNSTTYKQDSIERTNDGEKFKDLFNNREFHKARQAILERIQWFWEYIREYDDTARLESVLRYLLNIATDSNRFGTFTEEDIENLFKAFEPQELKSSSFGGALTIDTYLAQYGGDYTTYTFDGIEYYRIFNDTAGNPTVGAGDIQWLSNHGRFSSTALDTNGEEMGTGTVRYGGENGIVYENCDVEDKVNELLGPNGFKTKWDKNYHPDEEHTIYIDKETGDKASKALAMYFYNRAKEETKECNLSRQQLFALTYIMHATGNLDDVAENETSSTYKPFKKVYKEAQEKGHEPNSWTFNQYIWENWWSTKWKGGYKAGREYTGWLKTRDASFETYVKGTMNFGGNNSAAASRERNGYMFYSKENISKIGFSNSSNPANYARNRNPNDTVEEELLFTYEQSNSNVVDFALQFEGLKAVEIQPANGETLPNGLFSYKTSDGVQFQVQAWCADFVSFCFDQCGLLEAMGGTFQYVPTRINDLKSGKIPGYIEPGNVPQPGDIILLTNPGHTGIVVDVQGDKLITIEGNCSGQGEGDTHSLSSTVKKQTFRTIYDSNIAGYQRVN